MPSTHRRASRKSTGLHVPTDMEHWHYNAAREVRLPVPTERLFVRYYGDPAVNNFRIYQSVEEGHRGHFQRRPRDNKLPQGLPNKRFGNRLFERNIVFRLAGRFSTACYAHCVEDNPTPPSTVVIRHVWTDEEGRKTRQVELDGPDEYEIQVGPKPSEESIVIAVPSNGQVDEAEKVAQSGGTQIHDWVEPMGKVHSRFSGESGAFAQFGDSITDSRAFWYSLKWKCNNASEEMRTDLQLVRDHMLDECWDRKGAEYGNQSGQTVHWASKNLDSWLRQWNPEAAILMFGTNDLDNVDAEDYEATLADVVKRCLDNGTVVILSTIPPRHRFERKAAEFAKAARRVAKEFQIPLTDFHAEILRRRPHDWNGALDKFRQYQGYNVLTLIARDGVHPSNPTQYQGDYSEDALVTNGFSLRNRMVLHKYAEVIRNVLRPE